jgi:hypothetical protein
VKKNLFGTGSSFEERSKNTFLCMETTVAVDINFGACYNSKVNKMRYITDICCREK